MPTLFVEQDPYWARWIPYWHSQPGDGVTEGVPPRTTFSEPYALFPSYKVVLWQGSAHKGSWHYIGLSSSHICRRQTLYVHPGPSAFSDHPCCLRQNLRILQSAVSHVALKHHCEIMLYQNM
jgi:hypothetical protein